MKSRTKKTSFALRVELGRESDGRWIAEIPRLPGVMAYGATRGEAARRARAIALRTLADTVEEGHAPSIVSHIFTHAVGLS